MSGRTRYDQTMPGMKPQAKRAKGNRKTSMAEITCVATIVFTVFPYENKKPGRLVRASNLSFSIT